MEKLKLNLKHRGCRLNLGLSLGLPVGGFVRPQVEGRAKTAY